MNIIKKMPKEKVMNSLAVGHYKSNSNFVLHFNIDNEIICSTESVCLPCRLSL